MITITITVNIITITVTLAITILASTPTENNVLRCSFVVAVSYDY